MMKPLLVIISGSIGTDCTVVPTSSRGATAIVNRDDDCGDAQGGGGGAMLYNHVREKTPLLTIDHGGGIK